MTRWSKWKKNMEDLVCEDLKDRINFYATVYRKTHDQRGKVWIELDKEVIFEANTLEWEIEYFSLANEIRKINNCTEFRDKSQSKGYYQAYDDAEKILKGKHKIDEFHFYNAMKKYLTSSFEDSLKSDDTLTRILCLIDKRLGKRRLKEFRIKNDDCEAIKKIYNVRCQLSGIGFNFHDMQDHKTI